MINEVLCGDPDKESYLYFYNLKLFSEDCLFFLLLLPG